MASISEERLTDATRLLAKARREADESVEDAAYSHLAAALNLLLPTGYEARILSETGPDKPDDLAIVRTADDGRVAFIEVKQPRTLRHAFTDHGTGSQINRYRNHSIHVLLTDIAHWYDLSDPTITDLPEHPSLTIPSIDTGRTPTGKQLDPVLAATQRLRDIVTRICGHRPDYRTTHAAVRGITSIIQRIDNADRASLTRGWDAVKEGLGINADNHVSLDSAGVGELVAFTLLSIAAELTETNPLDDNTFADTAYTEWQSNRTWSTSDMPRPMRATLRLFRDEDGQCGGALLGPDGWVTLRSIGWWLASDMGHDSRWAHLSDLWDTYLSAQNRRGTLGSWQTPAAVAAFQAAEVATALRSLGYSGLADDNVTVIDPCCGTGVYLDAVLDQIVTEHASPTSINGDPPRLLGADISGTAVAATHIRIAPTGARPRLYMTDTLATGAGGVETVLPLEYSSIADNPIVADATADFHDVDRWASRTPDRPPVVAVIGNPPYLHAGLRADNYADVGWLTDIFQHWLPGSGGRGKLRDLYVGFWAWAASLCEQPHPALGDNRRGVISFITNRSWIETSSFRTMRAWFVSRAARITITDFGPGVRGGGAASWSDQPFEVQVGTAIVTIIFDPSADANRIEYRRAVWVDGQVRIESESEVASELTPLANGTVVTESWAPQPEFRSLQDGIKTVSGILTADDKRWYQVESQQGFLTRCMYRAFDNRWSPTEPPAKDELRPGATWRLRDLFTAHREHVAAGGWYLLLQAKSAKPGPAAHATRHLMDYHAFNSGGGRIVRVSPSAPIPTGYENWAIQHALAPDQFWTYILAACHHPGYWTDGHDYAIQLATNSLEPPLSDDPTVIASLIEHGHTLIDLWSLDATRPVVFDGKPGDWHFDGHDTVDSITIHGRAVLAKWRADRPGPWRRRVEATEYARSVAALLDVAEIRDAIGGLLPESGA